VDIGTAHDTRSFEYHLATTRAARPHPAENPVNPAEVKALIQQGLPSATVEVSGEDHTHFEALVVSADFEGKRPLARHQMVYATLGTRMGREIHALSLRTLTPAEQRGG
jgi:acid stress-induced BolA-like protein IbaG/YrbA